MQYTTIHSISARPFFSRPSRFTFPARIEQMDQVTQQNAAMVEEATAASLSLKGEADQLLSLISHFQTGTGAAAAGHHTKATAPVAQQQKRVQRFASTQGNLAVNVDEDADWDSF